MTEELKELLGEDGSRVCKEVEKALQGGNARAKSAASVGAALLAAHAATWAERVSRATGKPFTAEDYMKSVTIDANGTVHEGALNALRSGVDLDERVPVLDIDAMDNRLRGMTNQQAAAFIAQLAQQSPILMLDASANVGISSRPYGKRHVVRNKATDRRKNLVATGKVLSNMEDFIKSSVVIEIAPNRKAGRNLSGMSDGQKRAQHHKNTVNAYYYIMLPVKHNNQLNTLVLIAEERNGCLVGETAQVELYQIQYANKERDPALMPTQHRVSINTRQHAPATVSIREMLAGVKTSDGNFYYQQAWHGAAKKFDAFSLDYVGTGDGGSAHAHGLYFAKERSFAESYRGEDGALLEVEIPDDEYLLKENAYFKEQSPSVQQALREIAEGWGEVERGEKSVDEALAGKSGRDLYFKVMEEVGEFARKEKCMRDDGTFFYICSDPLEGTEARVSEHFSKHGVKGISFNDYGDPGFVIFDPHDAEILARYQESRGQIQGQFSVLQEGSRLVSLFEAADESTFLHETAHIFYDDLARLAPFDEETAEDLAEVDAWASWYEGAAKEYEDTPWAMEFAARERAIREAIRTHDEALEERLKAEWRAERFARGFERYLEEGRAPTSTLQKVFDKCRTFVKTAYAAFRGSSDGGKASPAVEKVMAKLITPQEKELRQRRKNPMTNEARLLAERDRLFATISVSKERYRDFLETMADHYKQPLATQVGLFLHAPASGRAYAPEELWRRMGTSLKPNAKGIDVLSAAGEVTTVYEVTETEDAARLHHLVWQYDDAKDGESISSLNDMQKNDDESTEDFIVRLCREEAKRTQEEGRANLVGVGAAYIALSRMGFDAQKKLALPLIIAPYKKIDGEELLRSTMQTAAKILDRVASAVRTREREEREAIDAALETTKETEEIEHGKERGEEEHDAQDGRGNEPGGISGEDPRGSSSRDRAGGAGREGAPSTGRAGTRRDGEARGDRAVGADPQEVPPVQSAGGVAGDDEERRGGRVPAKGAGEDAGDVPEDHRGARAEGALGAGSVGTQGTPYLPEDRPRDAGGNDREPVDLKPTKDKEAADAEPIDLSQIDYEADLSTTKGKRAVFRRNLAAIQVMRSIEEMGRTASEEEAKLLGSYSGFGGLAEVFDPRNEAWRKEYEALRRVLTNEEYTSARSTILDAFYTPPEVAEAICKGLSRMGFTSGNILEPSCGSGRFFDAMPKEMREESHVVGIEMDALSARIAKAAHKDVEIFHQSFQNSHFANGSFDLAIGNVPFGDSPIYGDSAYEGQGLLPHDYFLLKMLDEVRDGGLVAAITSSGTMDKASAKVRARLAEKADLVTALRLPSEAFKGAGTAVTTDILVFRKKGGVLPPALQQKNTLPSAESWQNIERFVPSYPSSFEKQHTMNGYFVRNPEKILGEVQERSGKFGKEIYVAGDVKDLAGRIEEAFAALGEGSCYAPSDAPLAPPVQAEAKNRKSMGFTIEGGEVVFTDHRGETKKKDFTEEQEERVRFAVLMRDEGYRILDAQEQGVSNEDLREMQKKLRSLYDTYTEKFGYIRNDRQLKMLFGDDAGYPFIESFEVIGKDGAVERPADIFTERTVQTAAKPEHADTAQDALVISMQQKGEVDLRYMEELTGTSERDLMEELEYTHLFFDEKENRAVQADEYLSGDIYAKIEEQDAIINATAKGIDHLRAAAIYKGDVQRLEEGVGALNLDDVASPLAQRLHEILNDTKAQEAEEMLGYFTERREALMKAALKEADFEAHPEDRETVAKYAVALAEHRNVRLSYRDILPSNCREDSELLLELFKVDPRFDERSYGSRYNKAFEAMDFIGACYKKAFLEEPVDNDVFRKIRENLADGENTLRKLHLIHCAAAYLKEHKEKKDAAAPSVSEALERFQSEAEGIEERADAALSPEAREEFQGLFLRRTRAEKNRAALEVVKPDPIPIGDISFSLGSTWLNPQHVQDFIYKKLEIDRTWYNRQQYRDMPTLEISYSPETSKWKIEKTAYFKREYGTRPTPGMAVFSTAQKDAVELLTDCLNQNNTVVRDAEGRKDPEFTAQAQMKQEEIQQAFRDFLIENPLRAQDVERTYNRRFNNIRLRQYDGANLTFPGMTNTVELKPHQKDAIAHHLYGGNTLFAHCVGAGKTYEMIAAIMESKRMGLSEKAMMVVPNHLVAQTGDAFHELYPRAKVLVPTEKDLKEMNRKRFTAQIATQNWDAVIVPFSAFERLKLSAKLEGEMTENEIARLQGRYEELTATSMKNKPEKDFSIKEIVKSIEKLTAKARALEKKNQAKGDGSIPFDKLGIDKLVVDEVHYYKNLQIETRHSNTGGIGSKKHTDMTWDLYMKAQYMNEKTNYRGLIFATGTPISNSMSELYTLQRYLTPQVLKDKGVAHFDAWAANFAEISSQMELRPEGMGYQMKERMRAFNNVPELMTQFKLFADVRTADMLPDRKVPKAEEKADTEKASPLQKEMIQDLFRRGEAVRRGDPEMVTRADGTLTEDSMLMISREGRMLSLDPRIIDPSAEDLPTSKVNRCARNVLAKYRETTDIRGTQIIFCDDSTSTGVAKARGAFNVYDDLRQKLEAGGIPKEEIAVVQEYKKDAIPELFERVREGKVRVLLGSTDKLGVGTNVQDRLCASHDLSIPWRPADLEQRMGRSIRPGNQNESVEIYRYITEGTFDTFMWQTLENKQKLIAQMMTSKTPCRTIVDMDEVTLTFADLKAISTDNPFFKEKMELEAELVRCQMARASYETTKKKLTEFAEIEGPKTLKAHDARIFNLMSDKMLIEQNTEKNDKGEELFRMRIGKEVFTNAKKAALFLHEKAKGGFQEAAKANGEYKGMTLRVQIDSQTYLPYISLQGKMYHTVAFAQPGKEMNTIRHLDNVKDAIEKKLLKLQEEREPILKKIESAKEKIKEPFAQERREQEVKKRLLEINALIENAPSGEALAAHTTFERREEKDVKEEKKDERREAAQRYAEDYEEAAMAR